MKKSILFIILLSVSSSVLAGGDVRVISKYNLNETTARFAMALQEQGVPVLERRALDTGQGEEILFPSPYYGSRIGECHRGTRKDEPLIARIWQDNNKYVWLSYQLPDEQVNQFGVIECGNETDMVRRAVSSFATTATGN